MHLNRSAVKAMEEAARVDRSDPAYGDFLDRYTVYYMTVASAGLDPAPPPLNLTSETAEMATVAAYATWHAGLDPKKLADGDYDARHGQRMIRPPAPYEMPK